MTDYKAQTEKYELEIAALKVKRKIAQREVDRINRLLDTAKGNLRAIRAVANAQPEDK